MSEAKGDLGPLLAALASRPSVSSSSATKETVFVVFTTDSSRTVGTAAGVPASAVDDAEFQVIGTTPSGSL